MIADGEGGGQLIHHRQLRLRVEQAVDLADIRFRRWLAFRGRRGVVAGKAGIVDWRAGAALG